MSVPAEPSPAGPPSAAPGPLAGPAIQREAAPAPQLAWFAAHLAGLIALVLGVTGFLITSLTQEQFWQTPSWKITVPFLVATVAAAAVSFVRKERALALPLLGVGLAAAAMVLGWFLIMGIVVAVTALVILILSAVM